MGLRLCGIYVHVRLPRQVAALTARDSLPAVFELRVHTAAFLADALRALSCLLRPCRDLMGMKITRAELIDQCLLSDRDGPSDSRLKLVRPGQQ